MRAAGVIVVLAVATVLPGASDARTPNPGGPPIPHSRTIRSHAKAESEDVEGQYRSGYIEPRAYPDSILDPRARLRAFRTLDSTRIAQGIPHIPATTWTSIPKVLLSGQLPCGWYSVGPTNTSGRVTDLAIDPTNASQIYAATVGGVWRSVDGGRRWHCVTEDLADATFGCVAVNPANPKEVFAGGGDPNHGLGHDALRADGFGGTGLWVSTSGGGPGTWSQSAPGLQGRIVFRILIDPGHGNEVYAATNAGVFVRSLTATGLAWSALGTLGLPVCDLAADFSTTPPTLYAACYRSSTQSDLGIWKYQTGWDTKNDGIPADKAGGISLTLCADHPEVLYASIENAADGSLLGIYRTKSGGEPPAGGHAWTELPTSGPSGWSGETGYRWWYTNVIRVDPHDPGRVFLGGVDLGGTTVADVDGGFTTWDGLDESTDPGYDNPLDYLSSVVHDDVHAIAFLPGGSRTIFVASDGGIDKCDDIDAATRHWDHISHGLNLTEVYSLSTQKDHGSIIAAGAQDVGQIVTMGNMAWYGSHTKDIFSVAMDCQNPCLVYGAEYRSRDKLGSIVLTENPVLATAGYGAHVGYNSLSPKPVFPVVTDPNQSGAALAAGLTGGTETLLRITSGQTWSSVTGFASLGSNKQIWCLAIGPSSGFQAYYVGIRGVGSGAPGTSLAATMNGGGTWNTVSANVPNLLPNQIAVDWTQPQRAFVAMGGRRSAQGAIIMTVDGGATWTPLTASGPFTIDNTAVLGVAIDPFDNTLVYAATDISVFRGRLAAVNSSSVTWEPFDSGLPNGVRCSELNVIHDDGLLCLATFGHGVYQRNLDSHAECNAHRLMVRDNVLDTGWSPTPPSGVPNPEDPIPDPLLAGAWTPNDQPNGTIHYYSSTDIRTNGTATMVPPQNDIDDPDNVEFETCPTVVGTCPPGSIVDSDPTCDSDADIQVQVMNRGLLPVTNVRVIALWSSPTPALGPVPADFWTTTFPTGSTTCGALSAGSEWQMVAPCTTISIVNPGCPEVVRFHWNLPSSAREHSCVLVMADSPDDPLNAGGELRTGVLAPADRHVAVRNVHVITCTAVPGKPVPLGIKGVLMLQIAQELGPGKETGVHLILPRLSERHLKAIRRVPKQLSPGELEFARRWQLDDEAIYEPENDVSAIFDLPRNRYEKIGIIFQPLAPLKADSPRTSDVIRVSVTASDESGVIGGNTFLLKSPRVISRAKR